MKSKYSVFVAALVLPTIVLVACNEEDVVSFDPQPDSGDSKSEAGGDASTPDVVSSDAAVDAPAFDASPVSIACSTAPCAVELATTGASVCARLDDGTVRCWGANDNGQLGRGDMEAAQDSLPAPVTGLASVTHLSGGRDTYCATTQQGEVKCWGSNGSGQLGTTDSNVVGSSSNVPVTVAGLPTAKGAFVGDGIVCAVVDDGDVTCWGQGDSGRIPDASSSPMPPTKMDIGGRKARAVAPGAKSIVVLLDDGSLLSWGKRSGLVNSGVTTLGREASLDPAAPALLPTPVHADRLVGWGNAASAAANGGAFRWGSLDGINGPVSPLPVTFASSAKVLDVSLGEAAQFCAVMDNETIRCLGDNTFGQLGTGDFVSERLVPAIVKDLPEKPARVVTGGNSACAILTTGAVACWGQNSRGQLGTGDYVIHATPTPVRLSP